MLKTFTILDYFDNYNHYRAVDISDDFINIELKQAGKLHYYGNYKLSYDIICEFEKQSPDKLNFFVKFYKLLCLSKGINQDDILQYVYNEFNIIYKKYNFYPALWEMAFIDIQCNKINQAIEKYHFIFKNHLNSLNLINFIVINKTQYDILYPIVLSYNMVLFNYRERIYDRQLSILNDKPTYSASELPIILENSFNQANSLQPKLANKFSVKTRKNKIKILYVAHFEVAKPNRHANEIYYYFKQSSHLRGHEINYFNSGEQTSPPDSIQLKEFDNFLFNYQPNLIIYEFHDYNIPKNAFLSETKILQIKAQYNCKFLQIFPDSNNLVELFPFSWYNIIDLFWLFMPNNKQFIHLETIEKLLYFPSFKLNDNGKNHNLTKNIEFGFIGTKLSQREVFLKDIQNNISGARIYFNSNEFNTTEAYDNFMAQTKITFNTGYRAMYGGQNYFVPTGRINEAIINKCLLLEEGTMSCEDIYVPFVHYIPVYNRNDVMIYAQFFLKHEEWREKIVNEAYNFWQENYSYNHIWSEIERRLGFL